MAEADRLVGRDHAFALVRALMDRPVRERAPVTEARPVLVLEGARGSGKTSLCAAVDAQADQRVPHARVDLARAATASTPDVLSALAFQLSRACPVYGSVGFPRFTVGRLVMADRTIDLGDRVRARRQLTALLEEHRRIDALRELLQETAGSALDAVQASTGLPVGPVGRRVPGWVLDRIEGGGPGRRVALGAYQDWFGHRGRRLPNQAADVLVDLNARGRDRDDEEHAQWIRELLWDAFLTDLTEYFRTARRSRDLALTGIALLDNADSELGREFVTSLVRSRQDRVGDPDPLTVVVTSRGPLLADVPPAEIVEYGGDRPVGPEARALGRLRLGDLSEDDTRRMVQVAGLWTGGTMRLPALVHGATSGHPASARLLVEAAVQHPEDADAPAALLAAPALRAGPARASTATAMAAALLGDFPEDFLEDLTTCASAADQQHARALASGRLVQTGDAGFAAIRAVLWPEAGGAGPVVLRRLLIRELAARPAEHPAAWSAVMGWHREARASAGDPDGALHYALAAGDVAAVVRGVAGWTVELDSAAWIDRLRAIAVAPRRVPRAGLAPHRQVLALTRAVPSVRPIEIARLVLAHWVASDPFLESRRQALHLQIASDFEAVARTYPHDDVEPLLHAARRHRRSAEDWN